METRKSLLFSAGVLAIVALLAATNVFAQSSCTSKTVKETTGNFVVNVAQTIVNGRRTYTYTVTSPTNSNPNKFFVFVKKGLNNPPDLTSINGGGTAGAYLTPDTFLANNAPPSAAWNVVHHQDGVAWTAISLSNNPFTLSVSERYKPEESLTTVLLGIASTFEHCGPIFGPTTPEPPDFGGQFAASATNICFKNGCCYNASTDPTTGQVSNLVTDPATPIETAGCGGIGQPVCQACFANTTASCSADLNIPDCGKVVITAPLQSAVGGLCYYPENIKFRC